MPNSSASAEMLSQFFIRSSAISWNALGYFPTRFFMPTRGLFLGWVLLPRVSHFRGSVHSMDRRADDGTWVSIGIETFSSRQTEKGDAPPALPKPFGADRFARSQNHPSLLDRYMPKASSMGRAELNCEPCERTTVKHPSPLWFHGQRLSGISAAGIGAHLLAAV